MVPRFRRKKPPNHVLVARNGDMMRGTLVSISGQTVRFDSKLKERSVGVERLAQVVHVKAPDEDEDGTKNNPAAPAPMPSSGVRVTLGDGTMLVFEALTSTAGELRGRSTIYRDVAVQIDHVMDVEFGPAALAVHAGPFNDWITRPAPEPSLRNSQRLCLD